MDAPGTRSIEASILRQVLHNERKDMYRMLTDRGVNFMPCLSGENATHYAGKLGKLEGDYERDRLRAQVAALTQELTELKRAHGLPVEPEASPAEPPRPVKKFDL